MPDVAHERGNFLRLREIFTDGRCLRTRGPMAPGDGRRRCGIRSAGSSSAETFESGRSRGRDGARSTPCLIAHAAIRQSTPDRIVSPARRAARYRSTASSKTGARHRRSTTAARAWPRGPSERHARRENPEALPGSPAGRSPLRRSPRADRGDRLDGLRNTSIQTDVSTRSTRRRRSDRCPRSSRTTPGRLPTGRSPPGRECGGPWPGGRSPSRARSTVRE